MADETRCFPHEARGFRFLHFVLSLFPSASLCFPLLPSLSLRYLLQILEDRSFRQITRSPLWDSEAEVSLFSRSSQARKIARSLLVVRYFRQGVNRYRESRRCSSSSKLMQHLTFRYILLELAARAYDSLVSFFRSCLTTMYLLSFLFFIFLLVLVRNTDTSVQLPRVRLRHSCSTEVGSKRHLPGFTSTVAAPLRDERSPRGSQLSYLPSSPVLFVFTDFSLFLVAKHPETHVPAPSRRAPWNVKHIAYTPSFLFPLLLLFFLFSSSSSSSSSFFSWTRFFQSFLFSSLPLLFTNSLSLSLFRPSSETC